MSFVTTGSDSVPWRDSFRKVRTASSSLGSPIELAHPTPDLQSLQGAYVQNVERLEERAERMSVSSDLGEEIRKLRHEQKASDSRRASLYSGNSSGGNNINAAVEPRQHVQQRPRNVSTSSYANSIVEVNSAARYGGYSPYSPIGSLRSGSWSQVSHPMSNPMRSMSRSSKLGMMSTPEIGEAFSECPKEQDPVVDDNSSIQHTPRPQSKSNSSAVSGSMDGDTRDRRMKRLSTGRLPSDGSFSELYNQLAEANTKPVHVSGVRVASDSSFTDIYDQIAGEIKDSLDTSVIGAQERELKRQSLASTPQPLPPFSEPRSESSKPIRLSETPPPLPPQHKELPKPEPQEDYGINFSFTASIKEPQARDDRRASGPLQVHIPRDDYDGNSDDRPHTATSQDTYQQAEGLFQDFDGTHYAPSMLSRYNSFRKPGSAAFPVEDPNRSSMLKALPEESVTSLVPPPPEDGMVYYPAPVPRMLNLPQRISQAPSAAAMAKRKTQVINALPTEARRSAYWLPQGGGQPVAEPGTRTSRMNLAALPPQLRASVFFDPGSQRREIEIRDQSAVRTLDDLLDASALAPVSAFTDHPIVGKAGANVYKKSQEVQNSSMDLRPPPAKKERKSSFLGLRRSSVSPENAVDERRSVSPGRLSRSHSAMLDDSALARGPNGEIGGEGRSGRSSPALDPNGIYGDLRDHDVSDDEGGVLLDQQESSDEEEVGVPTTLLAELEMRKREQKNRNRNAFNAFPDGMHATLLELDDVAQLQKAKRKKTRVALAWEDPALKAADEMAEGDDEDIPLGVLYTNNKAVQQRIKEQDLAQGRPLGLIEKKEFEDNEPLSRRMLRLRGINPNAVRPPPVAITNPEGEEEGESEHEGETLGQRLKRLRDKKALDDTITEIEGRPVSEAFSVDVLSQLGVALKDTDDKKPTDGLHSRNVSAGVISTGSAPKSPGGGLLPPSRSSATTPGDSEDETLGQRRARLQREATQAAMLQRRQSGMTLNALNPNARMSSMQLGPSVMDLNQNVVPTPSRTPPPALRASVSMADLLAAYPSGKNDARKVSNDMLLAAAPQNSLLAKDAEEKAARKARMRLSSADLLQRPDLTRQASGMTGMTGMTSMSAGSGGMYMNQQKMYGMWAQQQNSHHAAMMNLHQQGYGYPQSQYGTTTMQQQYSAPSQYGMGMGLNGYGSMSNPNLMGMHGGGGVMGQQYGGEYGMPGREGFIDQRTRSRVDAWRQSIMP